jgi:hypothetical protein
MVEDYAAHCNAVSLGCRWLLLVLFDLLVVAALNVLAVVGPTHNRTPIPP